MQDNKNKIKFASKAYAQRGGAMRALLIIVVLAIMFFVGMTYIIPGKGVTTKDGIINAAKQRVNNSGKQVGNSSKSDSTKIRESIAFNRANIALVYSGSSKSASSNHFIARAITIDRDGYLVTDASTIKKNEIYMVRLPGKKDLMEAKAVGANADVAILKINTTLTMVAKMQSTDVKNGIVVAAIGGGEKEYVAVGKITDVSAESGNIVTNLVGKITPGTPLVDKFKNLIGISSGATQSAKGKAFSNIDTIKGALMNVKGR
jgi:hypothetical protein